MSACYWNVGVLLKCWRVTEMLVCYWNFGVLLKCWRVTEMLVCYWNKPQNARCNDKDSAQQAKPSNNYKNHQAKVIKDKRSNIIKMCKFVQPKQIIFISVPCNSPWYTNYKTNYLHLTQVKLGNIVFHELNYLNFNEYYGDFYLIWLNDYRHAATEPQCNALINDQW